MDAAEVEKLIDDLNRAANELHGAGHVPLSLYRRAALAIETLQAEVEGWKAGTQFGGGDE